MRLDFISDISKQLFTAHHGANRNGGNDVALALWHSCTPMQKEGVLSRRTAAANASNQAPLKRVAE